MPITAAALTQHIVDLVSATGFHGAAVVVLVERTDHTEYADVTVGSTLHNPKNIAAVLTLAAVTVEGDPEASLFMSPTPKPDRLD